MPGILPGWTKKDIEQQPNVFFRLRSEMLNVLYILEALRHNNIMPGLLPGWTRKDIEQLPNFFFILEALRHNYIPEYLRLNLRWARWDKCKYRHLTDLEADISCSRLSHWSYKRCPHCFVFLESLIKESLTENRAIAVVLLLQTTNSGWPERHVELFRHPAEYNLVAIKDTISSSIQIYLFVCQNFETKNKV